MKLTCVGFDLGYTLVHTHREIIFQKAAESLGISRELSDIFKAYHRTDKLFMRDFPGILCGRREDFMPFYFQKLLAALQIDLDASVVLHAFFSREKIQKQADGGLWFAYESSTDVLSMLKRQGLKTVLISNWDDTAISILQRNGIAGLLDEIVISSRAGVSKPDKRIFDMALSKVGALPSSSLYVGDNYYDDFIGASRAGMHCVLLNPFGRDGVEEIKHVDFLSGIHELPNYLKQSFAVGNEEKV